MACGFKSLQAHKGVTWQTDSRLQSEKVRGYRDVRERRPSPVAVQVACITASVSIDEGSRRRVRKP